MKYTTEQIEEARDTLRRLRPELDQDRRSLYRFKQDLEESRAGLRGAWWLRPVEQAVKVLLAS